MLKLTPANLRWWNKPLVLEAGYVLPAELVILKRSLKSGEDGVWLNSRGTKTGAIDLEETEPGKYKTVRCEIPSYVQDCLRSFYDQSDIAKGVYDLVLWHKPTKKVRFIEVKCPHWDRPTPEQRKFAQLAGKKGISVEIAEWEFEEKI